MNLDFEDVRSAVLRSKHKGRIPCPFCNDSRSKKANRDKPVFRVWLQQHDFLTYACSHCEAHGYLHAKNSVPIPVEKIAEMRRESGAQSRRGPKGEAQQGAVVVAHIKTHRRQHSRTLLAQSSYHVSAACDIAFSSSTR